MTILKGHPFLGPWLELTIIVLTLNKAIPDTIATPVPLARYEHNHHILSFGVVSLPKKLSAATTVDGLPIYG
jgi:hypothetical protein